MKRFTILPILMLTLWSGCSKSGGGVKLHTDTDSVAYVIGLNVGANLLKMDSTLNAAAVCKGIADYFAGRQSMTMEEAQTFLPALCGTMPCPRRSASRSGGFWTT